MVFFSQKKKKAETGIQKIWFEALVTLDASSDVPYAWRGNPWHFPLHMALFPEEKEDQSLEKPPPLFPCLSPARPCKTGEDGLPVTDPRGGRADRDGEKSLGAGGAHLTRGYSEAHGVGFLGASKLSCYVTFLLRAPLTRVSTIWMT